MKARGGPGSGVVQEAGAADWLFQRRKIWDGKEKMTWHGGTHELGRRIEKLLERIVF
jgi:hypothetical protein